MLSRDGVSALADKGYPASRIAAELGVSRQRIYQFAARFGIKLPSGYRFDAAPRPRVVTGGILQPVNQALTGTVSELLVAADLLARGWEAYFPIRRCGGHDLIAVRGSELITIEVRSGRRLDSGKVAYAKNKGRIPSSHFAAVLVGEPVQYEPDLPGV